MPAPTAYSEETFQAFLEGQLRAVAGYLGWTINNGDYTAIVEETLLAIGVATVEEAADLRQLRTLGRLYLWQAVVDATTADHGFSDAGASYNLDQVHQHAVAQLERARSDAYVYDAAYTVESGPVAYHRDPYADHADHLSVHIDRWQEQLKS